MWHKVAWYKLIDVSEETVHHIKGRKIYNLRHPDDGENSFSRKVGKKVHLTTGVTFHNATNVKVTAKRTLTITSFIVFFGTPYQTKEVWSAKCGLLSTTTLEDNAHLFYSEWPRKIWRNERYTLSNKKSSSWNFLSPEPEVTCGTVAIIIRVVLLSPYLRIRGVSLSSVHYNQSHRVYINRRQQYICLIWN